jgi:hypothetical protein
MKPREVLSKEDYSNYRNIRAVSILFSVFGTILLLGGIIAATAKPPDDREALHPAVGVILAIVGLTGAIGGIAAFRGNRRWAPLVYVMAALYILNFPLGTILAYVMFKGLSRYLASVDRIRAGVGIST